MPLPKENEAVDEWYRAAAETLVAFADVFSDGCPSNPDNLQIPYEDLFMQADMPIAVEEAARLKQGAVSAAARPSRLHKMLLGSGNTYSAQFIKRAKIHHRSGEPAAKRAKTQKQKQQQQAEEEGTATEEEEEAEEEEEEEEEEEPVQHEDRDDDGEEEEEEEEEAVGEGGEDDQVEVATSQYHAVLDSIRRRRVRGRMSGLEAYIAEQCDISDALDKHAALAIRRAKHFAFVSWRLWHVRGHAPVVLQQAFWGCATHVVGGRIAGPKLYLRVQPVVDFVARTHLYDPYFDAGHAHWVAVFSRMIPHLCKSTDKNTDMLLGWSIATTPQPMRFYTEGIFYQLQIPHPLFETRDTNDTRGVIIECMRQYGKTTVVVLFAAAMMLHGVDMNVEVKADKQTASQKNTTEILEAVDSVEEKRIQYVMRQQMQARLFTDAKVERLQNVIKATTSTAGSSRGFAANFIYIDEISFISFDEVLAGVAAHLMKKFTYLFMTTTPSHDETHEFTQILDDDPHGFWTIRFRSACEDCIARGTEAEEGCLHRAYARPGHYAEKLPLALLEMFAANPDIADAELFGHTPNKADGAYGMAMLRAAFGLSDIRTFNAEVTHATSTAHFRLALEHHGVKHFMDAHARTCAPERWSLLMIMLFQPLFLRGLITTARSLPAAGATAHQIVDLLWENTEAHAIATRVARMFLAEKSGMCARTMIRAFVTAMVGSSDVDDVAVHMRRVVHACVSIVSNALTMNARRLVAPPESRMRPARPLAATTPRVNLLHNVLFITSDLPAHGKSEFTVMIHGYLPPARKSGTSYGPPPPPRFLMLGIDSWMDCFQDNERLCRRAEQLLRRVLNEYGHTVNTAVITVERNTDSAKATALTMHLYRASLSAGLHAIPRYEGDHIMKHSSQEEESPDRAYGLWSVQKRWSFAYFGARTYMTQYPILTDGQPITLDKGAAAAQDAASRGMLKMGELVKQMAYQSIKRPKRVMRLTTESSHPYEFVASVIVEKSRKVLDDLAKTFLIAFWSGEEYIAHVRRMDSMRDHDHDHTYIGSSRHHVV